MYEAMRRQSKRFKESNDCSVVATAIAFDVPYKVAHEALRRFGRKHGRGVYYFRHIHAIRLHVTTITGKVYEIEEVDLEKIRAKKGSGVTGMTVSDWLPKRGRFLCGSRGHVAAVRGGEMHDWSANRKTRITKIVKVKTL